MITEKVIADARSVDLVGLIQARGIELSRKGSVFVGLCPFHSERTPSFTVNQSKGFYKCYGCGVKGDSIEFVKQHQRLPFQEAVHSILGNVGTLVPEPRRRQTKLADQKSEWSPVTPVPNDAGQPPNTFSRPKGEDWESLESSRRWAYLDTSGRLIGYVCRFELPGGGKDLIPQSYCVNSQTGESRWKWLSFAKPRPIYGLEKLALHSKAQIIVVEGEKACDAARDLFLEAGISEERLIVVSWPGGAKAVKHVDWAALSGRKIGLWPDADQKTYIDRHLKAGKLLPFLEQPGTVAMLDVFDRIKGNNESVKFFLPPAAGVPDGWDLADKLPSEDFSLLVHIRSHSMNAADVQRRFSLIPSISSEGKIRPIWLVPSTEPSEIRCAAFAADVLALSDQSIAQDIDHRGVILVPYCNLNGLLAAIKETKKFLPDARLHVLIPHGLGDGAPNFAEEYGATVQVLQSGEFWVESIWLQAGFKKSQLEDWADEDLKEDVGSDESAQVNLLLPTRDAERRRQQQEENARIQEDDGAMIPAKLALEEMLERCVWLAEGEVVAYVTPDRSQFLTFKEFKSLTAESFTTLDSSEKKVLTANLWQSDQRRRSAMTRTFKAGAGVICSDPEGDRAVNLWRPICRWPAMTGIDLFLDHIAYLFEDETERNAFLDWCAHLEQRPDELPHYGWLHIASHTGCGRNWLASLLARIWRGYVAPNVDLPALLDSQYNGSIAKRILAIVDEVQEGGSGNRRHTNRLTALINAETRLINPKFGRQFQEFNSCRWLVFSNHTNALPIDNSDRRWRVIRHENPPRPAADYEALYSALADKEFINAVGQFFKEREIKNFKPGERPPLNAAKMSVIDASKPMQTALAEDLRDRWPADIILNDHVAQILADNQTASFTPAMRRAMEEVGAVAMEGQIKIAHRAQRGWILRNPAEWVGAPKDALRTEINRAGVNEYKPASAVLADTFDDEPSF